MRRRRMAARPPFFLGLALGQPQNYTAIAVLEQRPVNMARPTYHLRHLERMELGTPYPAIVARVRGLMSTGFLGQNWRAYLVADATGVGPAVIDLFRQAGLHPQEVTIAAGGDAVRDERGTWRVPKRDLASTIHALLQTKRLRFAEGLALGPILTEAVLAFHAQINQQPDGYVAWREGQHDDLVFAVALPVWWANEGWRPPLPEVQARILRGKQKRIKG